MFVTGPYVQPNSFSIREVLNHTLSHIMGLTCQKRHSSNSYSLHFGVISKSIRSRPANLLGKLNFNLTCGDKTYKIPSAFRFFMLTKTGPQSIPCNSNWMHWGLWHGWGRPSIQANRLAYCFYGTCPPRLITPRSALAKHAWIPEITILIQH